MAWFGGDEPGSPDTMETAVARLKALMGLPDGPRDDAKTLLLRQSKYGLGDRRSLEQFIAFSGIDTVNRRIIENRCGNIEFVPFKEHPLGPDYIPKFDPVTEYYADKWYDGSIYLPGSTGNSNIDLLLPQPKNPPVPLLRKEEVVDLLPPVATQTTNIDSKISLVYTKKIFELPLHSVPTEELITGSTLFLAVCVVITVLVCLLRKPSVATGSGSAGTQPRTTTTRVKQPEFSKNV
jgi:hypothetical protein